MGDRLRFDELRDANTRRCERHYHPIAKWSLSDWMTAVAGEVGEAASIVKNFRRRETEAGNSHKITETAMAALGEECADAVIYIDLLCARAGIDLGKAVREKFNKVSRERLGTDIVLEQRQGDVAARIIVGQEGHALYMFRDGGGHTSLSIMRDEETGAGLVGLIAPRNDHEQSVAKELRTPKEIDEWLGRMKRSLPGRTTVDAEPLSEREWLLRALNMAWCHGCRVGQKIGRKLAHTPEKPGPNGSGDTPMIIAEIEEAIGPHPLLATVDRLRTERDAEAEASAALSARLARLQHLASDLAAAERVIAAAREVRRGCWRCTRISRCEDCATDHNATADAVVAAISDYDAKRGKEGHDISVMHQAALGMAENYRAERDKNASDLVAAERVIAAAREWWRSKRPDAWTASEHRQRPAVNTATGWEQHLAKAYADYDAKRGKEGP